VPLLSCVLVAVMLAVSILLFSRLVQRLSELQINNVLHMIGDNGRKVIREMFQFIDEQKATGSGTMIKPGGQIYLGPVTQTLKYAGQPRTITRFDIRALVDQAKQADAVIVMACAVGDTLVEDSLVLRVHGATKQLSEFQLRRAVHLDMERTFEQDPKYPIRLLVDIAIKALSPAINDPTTAVQAIDQIEDLLRRLGRRGFDRGHVVDAVGDARLIFPVATWEDYLTLAFDEIRQFGTSSIQVMRRLRSALTGVAESLASTNRADAVKRYLSHLDLAIEHSPFDADVRAVARQEDPQGLGLTRRRVEQNSEQCG
jgi:uncharacterized membrane protein